MGESVIEVSLPPVEPDDVGIEIIERVRQHLEADQRVQACTCSATPGALVE